MAWVEWEEGTVKVPAVEFRRIHKSVAQADSAHKDSVWNVASKFWQMLDEREKSDRTAYFRAQRDYFRLDITDAKFAPEVLEDSFEKTRLRGNEDPHALRRSALDYPTPETYVFKAAQAQIIFDRLSTSIRWRVPSGYGAVQAAHAHPTAKVLFRELSVVRWLPGTGGWIKGNDDTNRDYEGAGAQCPPYVIIAWGPLGEDAPRYP